MGLLDTLRKQAEKVSTAVVGKQNTAKLVSTGTKLLDTLREEAKKKPIAKPVPPPRFAIAQPVPAYKSITETARKPVTTGTISPEQQAQLQKGGLSVSGGQGQGQLAKTVGGGLKAFGAEFAGRAVDIVRPLEQFVPGVPMIAEDIKKEGLLGGIKKYTLETLPGELKKGEEQRRAYVYAPGISKDEQQKRLLETDPGFIMAMGSAGEGMNVIKGLKSAKVGQEAITAAKAADAVPPLKTPSTDATRRFLPEQKKEVQNVGPLSQEAREYKSADEFINTSPTYYHTTKSENVSSIEKQGFRGEVGEMSKAAAGDMQKGVFLYPEKSSAEVFGKNFQDPHIIETKVNGKIYDANTQAKYGWEDDLQTQEIAKDRNIIDQLRKDGFVGVKSTELGTDAIFVFDKSAVKTKSQLTDIWNKAQDTTQTKKVPQVFRSDKLNVTPDQEAQIVNRLKALGLETRGVRTFEEMQAAAQELGADPNKLLRDVNRNRITDAEVVGLRELINNNTQFVAQAEKRLAADPRLEADLAPRIALANQQLDAAIRKVTQGGTEAGRAVVAYKILARESMEPAFWFTRAQRELGKRDLTNELKGAILDLIDKKDRNGLATFVAGLHTNTLAERVMTLWKAGLLTSPTTHMANILGNTTSQLLENASDVVALPLDVMASLFTKKRTTTISPRVIMSQIKGTKKGISRAGSFFRDGVYPQDLSTKWDMPHKVNFHNKILDGYTAGVFRSLGAEDIFFREIAMAKSFTQQATVIAKNEGLRGSAFRNRVKELMQQPTNGMVVEAINDAEYATFQNKTALGTAAQSFKGQLSNRGGAVGTVAGELVAPFTQTPTSIASRIIDYSPAGLVKTLVRAIKPSTRSQKNIVKELSRNITGTGVIALGSVLAAQGLMTGNVPTDPKEREQFYAEGKQPNSVLINGTWVNLSKISPLGNLLGVGANFHDLSTEKEGLDLYSSTAFSGVKGLADMSFLKGASGTLQAITDPERNAAKFAESTLASVVPTGVTRIGSIVDPRLRDPNGILQTIQARIPGLAGNVPLKRDILGQEIERGGGRFGIIDPFSMKKASTDPTIIELNKIGVNVGMPATRQAGLTLTNKEFSSFQELNGSVLKDVLDDVINTEEYKNLDDTAKRDLVDGIVKKVRSYTRDAYVPSVLIERYGLPGSSDPTIVYEVFKKVQSSDAFKELDDKEQEDVMKDVLKEVMNSIE